MKQNQELNNTCILFDKSDEAQQKAIIKFYNDNGYEGNPSLEWWSNDCIGVFQGVTGPELDYWDNDGSMQVIELPSEYYPKIVESEKTERFIKPTDKQIIEMAILVSQVDGNVNQNELANMLALSNLIIDRLYENGDILKPSKQEIEDEPKGLPCSNCQGGGCPTCDGYGYLRK